MILISFKKIWVRLTDSNILQMFEIKRKKRKEIRLKSFVSLRKEV